MKLNTSKIYLLIQFGIALRYKCLRNRSQHEFHDTFNTELNVFEKKYLIVKT